MTTVQHRDGTLERRQAILRDARIAILRDHGPARDLPSVAREIGVSPRHLQRVFADFSDQSFRDTLLAVRMTHARKLLAETADPIHEIAAAVGYERGAQFAKAFRRAHGRTPTDYRQRHRRTD